MRPSSGQLGTGSGNGLIEFGLPTDYKTQNTDDRGGLQGQELERQARVPRQQVRQRRARRRSGRTSSCAARSTPRCCRRTTTSRSGRCPARGATCRWDSTVLARYTQSKLTNSFDVMGGGLKGDVERSAADRRRLPRHRAELVDVRRRHQDDDGHRVVAATRRRSPGSTRASTTSTTTRRTTRRRSRTRPAGCRRPTPAASQQRDAVLHGRVRGARATSSTRRTSRPRPQLPDRRPSRRCSAVQLRADVDRAARAGAAVRRTRGRGSSTATRMGEAERAPASTSTCSATRTSTPRVHEQRRQRAADDGAVLLHGLRRHELRPEHGQAQRRLEPGAAAGRSASAPRGARPTTRTSTTAAPTTRRSCTTLSVSYGDPDKFRITGIGNWGEVKFDQAYRNIAHRPRARPPGGTQTATTSTGARRTPRTTGWSRCWPTGCRWTSCG